MIVDELKKLILDAANRALETSPRFSCNDIYRNLMIQDNFIFPHDCRGKAWEERTSLISPIRIRNTLLEAGFATNGCGGGLKGARYYRPARCIIEADGHQADLLQIEIRKRTASAKVCSAIIEA